MGSFQRMPRRTASTISVCVLLLFSFFNSSALADCQQQLSRAREIAAKLSVDFEATAHAQAGHPIRIGWNSGHSKPLEIPFYLVVVAAQDSRFAGVGFVALNTGAKGLSGVRYGEDRVRAFVPLYRKIDANEGGISIVPYRSGTSAIDWAVVTGGACGEHVLEKGRHTYEVAAGRAEIVIQDRFTNEQPLRRVLSPDGLHELLIFKDRYEVYEIASHIKVLDRSGTDPNFSPTGRFIAARGSDGIFDLISGTLLNTEGLGDNFLAWVRGDSFAIIGATGWEQLNVVSTMVNDRKALEAPTPCGACKAFDITVALDVDKGFVATKSSDWRVEDLASGQIFPVDLVEYERLVAENKSESAEAKKLIDEGYDEWSDPTRAIALLRERYDPKFVFPNRGWALGERLALSHIQTQSFIDTEDERRQKAALLPGRPYLAVADAPATDILRGRTLSSRGFEVGGKKVVVPNTISARALFSAGAFERLNSIGISTIGALPISSIAKRPYTGKVETRFNKTIESIKEKIIHGTSGSISSLPANSSSGRCEGSGEGWNTDQVRYDEIWTWRDADSTYWLLYARCIDGTSHLFSGQLALIRAGVRSSLVDLYPAFDTGDRVENEFHYSLGSGVGVFRPADGLVAIVFGNDAHLVNLRDGKRTGHSAHLVSADLLADLRLTTDGRYLVQLNRDGRIVFYKISDGAIVLSGAYVDDEIVIATSDGLYDSTFDGAQSVQVRFPGIPGLHYFNQFEKLLHREGLGPSVLAHRSIDAAPIVTPPPYTQLTLDTEVVSGNRTGSITSSAELGLSGVRLYMDGRLWKALPASGTKSTIKVVIPDPGGGHWISAVAVDSNGIVSLPSAIKIPGPPRARGTLRAVLMGVNTYADQRLHHLDFAESDAVRLGKALNSREGFLMRDVSVKPLTGRDIAPSTLLAEVDAAAAATTADDMLLFFYSGHGIDGRQLGHPELGWLLATPKTKLADIGDTAVAWSELAKVLSKARGTVVVTLDACHSGAAADSLFATNDDLIRSLAGKSAPIIILAAAKGRQSSYEDSDLRAGVFTSVISEAISGSRAGGHERRKHPIDLVELYRVVKARVLKIERGKQTPWLVRNALIGDITLF